MVCGPQLQGQPWRQQPVSDPADLCWVSPDQLNHSHVSQVKATLSVLFTHKMQRQIYNVIKCVIKMEWNTFSCDRFPRGREKKSQHGLTAEYKSVRQ